MSRIAYCDACSMQDAGVKTRIPLEHTCGRETGAISEKEESRIARDRKNGCQACHFEKENPGKKSRQSHICGK